MKMYVCMYVSRRRRRNKLVDGRGEEIDWPCKKFGEEEMWGRSEGSSAKRSSRVSQIVKVNLTSHRRRQREREREREYEHM